jgi:Winged helix-turn helix
MSATPMREPRATPRSTGPHHPAGHDAHHRASQLDLDRRCRFLDPELRRDLIDLGRDGSVAHRLARRANALVLLDDGMSCGDVARVLLLDDDTVRTCYRLYQEDGIEELSLNL